MGTHHDHHVTRVLHEWRRRARDNEARYRDAERLLREVATTASAEFTTDTDIAYAISTDLYARINRHLVQEDQ